MDDQTPPTAPLPTPPVNTAVARRTPWRLIAVAAVVVAAVVVGVVVMTGGDESGGGGGDRPVAQAAGEWHLARYVSDDEIAMIEVLAADLTVMTSVGFTTDGVPALAPALGRWLPTDAESGEIEVLDLAEGTSTTVLQRGAKRRRKNREKIGRAHV